MRRLTLVAVALLLLSSGRPLPPLEEQLAVYWEPGECASDAEWVAEMKIEGYTDWEPIEWGWIFDSRPEGGDVCAFATVATPLLRACCVRGDERVCNEAVEGAPTGEASRIFDLFSGQEYDSEDVAGWNELHAGE